MKSMMTEAATLAGDAAAEGKCVLVLFPCSLWRDKAHQYLDDLGGEENGIYTRYSDLHYSLKTVAPDVLILVAVGDPGWDKQGTDFALDKLQVNRGKAYLLYLEDDDANE
jgi:hypothetical protein